MLTLKKDIPQIAFARNPIPLIFEARDAAGLAYRSYGASAWLSTTATVLTEADRLTLSFMRDDGTFENIEFLPKANPTQDNHIPLSIADVADKIGKHPSVATELFLRYFFQAGHSYIVAECLDRQIQGLVSWIANLGTGVTETIVNNRRDTIALPEYSIEVKLYVEEQYKEGKWKETAYFELKLDDDGNPIPCDLSNVLSRECDRTLTENPFLRYADNTPTITDNLRRFYIKYREKWQDGGTAWVKKQPCLAFAGGVPNRLFLVENYDFFVTVNADNAALTYRPQPQKVRLGQPAYLSWFNFKPQALTVRLRVEYVTNSGATIVVNRHQIVVDKNETVTFPVGPHQLGMPAANVLYYTIAIVELVSNELLAIRQPLYIVDTKSYRSTRNLGYLNAFGCPETVLCCGDFTKTAEVERTQYAGVRYDESNRAVPVMRQTRGDYKISWTYRPGFLTRAESEQLTELEMSRVLFDLTNGSQIALVLKEAKSTIKSATDSSEYIYEREIVASPQMAINNFVPDSYILSAGKTENVLEIIGGNGNGGPVSVTPVTPTDPDNNPINATPLGQLTESSLILFALLDANGKVAGFKTVPSGEYMRRVRGLAIDAASHLDGLVLRDPQTETKTRLHIKDGDPKYI